MITCFLFFFFFWNRSLVLDLQLRWTDHLTLFVATGKTKMRGKNVHYFGDIPALLYQCIWKKKNPVAVFYFATWALQPTCCNGKRSQFGSNQKYRTSMWKSKNELPLVVCLVDKCVIRGCWCGRVGSRLHPALLNKPSHTTTSAVATYSLRRAADLSRSICPPGVNRRFRQMFWGIHKVPRVQTSHSKKSFFLNPLLSFCPKSDIFKTTLE